jgi:hypothetical protein
LIYTAAFKDRTDLNHEEFYIKEVKFLNHPQNKTWRGHLYTALEAWYTEFKPTKKRSRRSGPIPVEAFDIDDDGRVFMDDLNTFNDPLAEPPAAGAALAAAAAAALSAGAAGGPG